MVFWNVRLELLKYLLHQGQDPEGIPGASALLGRELEMGVGSRAQPRLGTKLSH